MRFVVLFPNCPDFGLIKDVGQLPNALAGLNNDITSVVASALISDTLSNKEDIENLQIERISYPLRNVFLSGVFYIIRNAKKVDWFNFYHGGRRVLLWTKLYKLLNRKGKVYLKLDLSYAACEKYCSSPKEIARFNATVEAVDLVSVESGEIANMVHRFSRKEVMLIPNGYVKEKIAPADGVRENAFITVARLGTYEKATDVLLEAFALSARSHDWKLLLVGPVEPSFQTYIDSFFDKYPELISRVIFIGNINNKSELYSLYKSSRVFVLPSRCEGFPLVGPEALHCGCRMILSDRIPPFEELSGNGRFGVRVKVDDVESLSKALTDETLRTFDPAEAEEICAYAEDNLSWEKISEKLLLSMEGEQNR